MFIFVKSNSKINFMKSLNFFYPKENGTGSEISIIPEEQKQFYEFNCLFIDVVNYLSLSGEIICDNDHLNQKPNKRIEGVNNWSGADFSQVGFWKVKYKNQ